MVLRVSKDAAASAAPHVGKLCVAAPIEARIGGMVFVTIFRVLMDAATGELDFVSPLIVASPLRRDSTMRSPPWWRRRGAMQAALDRQRVRQHRSALPRRPDRRRRFLLVPS